MNDYVVAKYLRLSSEDTDLDEGGKEESNSIVNQRNLLDDFIARHPDFTGARVLEFCDDGYSGKNFDRPAVTELLEQVKNGAVHCIVVKDLSRFGRDYLTVGNYISRVFPFLDVRFIAVNDNIDSIRQNDVDSMETSFKALIYDYYSRDLSRKVRSGRNSRAQRGLFIGPFAPYGYAKDPAGRHRLIIDPEAAAVVRRVFELICSGKSTAEVARIMNGDGVLTPMLYKRANGCKRQKWESVSDENYWTRRIVLRIIHDERYIGSQVFGKNIRDRVGYAHTISQSKQDWVIRENMHDPIVSAETFELAQKMIGTRPGRRDKMIVDRPLNGKVRCGVCGHVMERRRRKSPDYRCRTPQFTDNHACPTNAVPEVDLLNAVETALRTEVSIAVELQRVYEEQRHKSAADLDSMRSSLAALREQSGTLDQRKKALFEEWAQGNISDGVFRARKEALNRERKETTDQIDALEKQIDAAMENSAEENEYLNSFTRYSGIQEITSEITKDTLQEIRVFPQSRIEIIWNHRTAKEKLLAALSDLHKSKDET